MDNLNFDLHDEETFAFDDSPDEFVRLDSEPIVFSVRGIAYFGPRFKAVGYDIADISTAGQFNKAYNTWLNLEVQLLTDSIAQKAQSTHQANEHQVFLAAITGGFEEAAKAAHRLQHKSLAKLRAVE